APTDGVVAVDTSNVKPASVAKAEAASTHVAPRTLDTLAASSAAIVIEKPGAKSRKRAVLSRLDHSAKGTRSDPACSSESAAARYDIESGSSPGPGGRIDQSAPAAAASPNKSATAQGMARLGVLISPP